MADNEQLKILVVRADRLGDVILSTPVFEVIKHHYPKSHLTVMVRAQVAPVIRGLPYVDKVIIYDPDGKHAGLRGFFRLFSEIRARKFRIAVVLQTQFTLALALFLAQVRYRVGPRSKLHSYFFYNRGARQRRSQVEMHETDYNLQLLRRLGIRVGTRNILPRVAISDEAKAKAQAWLGERGVSEGESLVVVHPGMGGSALNWPETHYIELIRSLIKEGRKVLVTAGPDEGSILGRIREGVGNAPLFYGAQPGGSIEDLGGLYTYASVVIAPSTGPLHLAVALGKPTVTFYPPIRVQSAVRWGPYLRDESLSSVLVPEVYCGEDFECRGKVCHYFPCMKSLTVTETLKQVKKQLSRHDRDTSVPPVIEKS